LLGYSPEFMTSFPPFLSTLSFHPDMALVLSLEPPPQLDSLLFPRTRSSGTALCSCGRTFFPLAFPFPLPESPIPLRQRLFFPFEFFLVFASSRHEFCRTRPTLPPLFPYSSPNASISIVFLVFTNSIDAVLGP